MLLPLLDYWAVLGNSGPFLSKQSNAEYYDSVSYALSPALYSGDIQWGKKSI